MSKPLADALTEVLMDAHPWWRKLTKRQRFRIEIIGHEAAAMVENMRR